MNTKFQNGRTRNNRCSTTRELVKAKRAVAKMSIEFNLFCILATNGGMQDVKLWIHCSLLNYYPTSNKTVCIETTTYLFFVSFQVSVFHWQLCLRVRSYTVVSTMNYHCDCYKELKMSVLYVFGWISILRV